MRLYHALAIGLWLIFTNQGSAANSSDVCSGITYIVSNGTSRILKLSVNNSTITPTNNCSCEIMTDHPVMFLCLYNQSASCPSCSSDECLSSDVDSNNNRMCISISVNLIYPRASERNDSCPTSTNLTINLSMKSSSECSGRSNGNTFNLIAFGSCNDSFRAFLNATCRSVTTEASSTTVPSNAWNSWSTSATTSVDTETTSRSWHTDGWDSTERGNTTPSSTDGWDSTERGNTTSSSTDGWDSTERGNTTPSSTDGWDSTERGNTTPSSTDGWDSTERGNTSSTSLASAIRTEVHSNTVHRGPSSDASADQTTSSQSSLTTEMIIGIGVGIGVACGVLLIIAIIVVFIIRKRRAGYNKHHITNPSQTTAADPSQTPYTSFTNPDSAAYDNATTDTALTYQLVADTSFTNPDSAAYDNATTDAASSYQLLDDTSYTDPASAAYDNATTITELSYPIVANDHKTVGEANYEYTEVKKPEAISSPNSYDYSTTEIGRNEAYSTINAMGNNYDNVNENTSTKIEHDMTLIDNELYG